MYLKVQKPAILSAIASVDASRAILVDVALDICRDFGLHDTKTHTLYTPLSVNSFIYKKISG